MSNKYAKDVSHIETLDAYRLQELYQMHPCAEHVVKKLIVAGQRSGGKTLDQDIADCIQTLERWQAMRAEDVEYAAAVSAQPWPELEPLGEPPAVEMPDPGFALPLPEAPAPLPPLPSGTVYFEAPPLPSPTCGLPAFPRPGE